MTSVRDELFFLMFFLTISDRRGIFLNERLVLVIVIHQIEQNNDWFRLCARSTQHLSQCRGKSNLLICVLEPNV